MKIQTMKMSVSALIVLTALAGCTAFDRDELKSIKEMENSLKNSQTESVDSDGVDSAPAVQSAEVLTIDRQKFEDLASLVDLATIKTNVGDIQVKFYGKESPNTVNNFLNLAKVGFYNGTKFHRVISDFMIQGGDPNSRDADPSNDGKGGPGYKFADEFNDHKLVKGSLAMANSGANTNGSQFFIVTAESTPWLDGKHTNFGEVTAGMNIVETIGNVQTDANDRPIEEVIINSIDLTYKTTTMPEANSVTPEPTVPVENSVE